MNFLVHTSIIFSKSEGLYLADNIFPGLVSGVGGTVGVGGGVPVLMPRFNELRPLRNTINWFMVTKNKANRKTNYSDNKINHWIRFKVLCDTVTSIK